MKISPNQRLKRFERSNWNLVQLVITQIQRFQILFHSTIRFEKKNHFKIYTSSIKWLWYINPLCTDTWIYVRQCDVFYCSSNARTRCGSDFERRKQTARFSMEGFGRPLPARNSQYLHGRFFLVATLSISINSIPRPERKHSSITLYKQGEFPHSVSYYYVHVFITWQKCKWDSDAGNVKDIFLLAGAVTWRWDADGVLQSASVDLLGEKSFQLGERSIAFARFRLVCVAAVGFVDRQRPRRLRHFARAHGIEVTRDDILLGAGYHCHCSDRNQKV